MKFVKPAAALGALALTISACGTSLDREGTIDEMVNGGVPRDVATCIVDESVAEFGEDRILELNDEDGTPEENAKLEEITIGCLGS